MISKIKKAFSEMFLVWKEEYIKIFSDVGVLILLIGASLLYPIVYGLSYNTETLEELPVAIIDNDFSSTSRQLVRMIDATPQIKINARLMDMVEAKDLFYKGEIYGIIQIPKDFNKNILLGEQAFLNLYADGSCFLIYKQVYQSVVFSSGAMGAGIEIKKRIMKGMPEQKAISEVKVIDHVSTELYNPAGGYGTYVMPAALILVLQQVFLLIIGMLGGTEKEKGAVHYLLPHGSRRGGALRVLLGKTGAFLSLMLIISFYLYYVIGIFFKFPMIGKLPDILFFIFPFLLAVIFLSIILASFFRNRENSMMFLLFTSFPFVLISGFSWPVEAFPLGLETFSKLIPSTPALQGYLKISQMGASIQQVGEEWLHLWILAFVYGTIAMLILSKMIKQAKKIHSGYLQ